MGRGDRGQTAWAEGIGERLIPIQAGNDHYAVVIPPVAVTTERVFQHPDLPRSTPAIASDHYAYEQTVNDMETVTRALHPEVDQALRALAESGPVSPRMSGSGSAVFTPCRSEELASSILNQTLRLLNDPAGASAPFQGFIARGVSRSPLHQQLG